MVFPVALRGKELLQRYSEVKGREVWRKSSKSAVK